jgi:hypothetical protein
MRSFMTCIFCKILLGPSNQGGWDRGTCSKPGEIKKCNKNFSHKTWAGDLGMCGRIILKWMSENGLFSEIDVSEGLCWEMVLWYDAKGLWWWIMKYYTQWLCQGTLLWDLCWGTMLSDDADWICWWVILGDYAEVWCCGIVPRDYSEGLCQAVTLKGYADGQDSVEGLCWWIILRDYVQVWYWVMILTDSADELCCGATLKDDANLLCWIMLRWFWGITVMHSLYLAIKGREFVDQLNSYQLPKKDPVS